MTGEGRDQGRMDEIFDALIGYCSDDERSDRLKKTFLDPVLCHLTNKFNWVFRAVQAVAILVVLQFIFVAWILVRSYRKST